MAVLQIRLDDDLKKQASILFDELGLDLSTAVRMFLKKAVSEKGLPFNPKIDEATERGIAAIEKMRAISRENGNSEMTLEEINEEIRLAREERHKREHLKEKEK